MVKESPGAVDQRRNLDRSLLGRSLKSLVVGPPASANGQKGRMPEGFTLGHRPNRGQMCRNSVKLRLTTTARVTSYFPRRSVLTLEPLALCPLLALPLKGGGWGGGPRPSRLRKRHRRGPPPGGLQPPPPPFRGRSGTRLPFRGRNKVYIGRAGRPEEAPKPSIRASVPSSDDSRALTSSNRV